MVAGINNDTPTGYYKVAILLSLVELILILIFVFVPTFVSTFGPTFVSTFVLSLFLSVLGPVTIFVEIVEYTSVQYMEKTLLRVVIYACSQCTFKFHKPFFPLTLTTKK